MFYRKVLLLALLAVVLLGSFVEMGSIEKPRKRRHLTAAASGISAVAPSMKQASPTNLVDQLAFREKRNRPKPRASLMSPEDADAGMKITADTNKPCVMCADLTDQLVFREKRVKHKRTA